MIIGFEKNNFHTHTHTHTLKIDLCCEKKKFDSIRCVPANTHTHTIIAEDSSTQSINESPINFYLQNQQNHPPQPHLYIRITY